MKAVAALCLLSFLLSSCGTFQIYRTKPGHPYYYSIWNEKAKKKDIAIREDFDYTATHHYFLWGSVGHNRVYLSKACGKRRFHGLYTYTSFLNAIGTALTLGLWVPKTAEVWCG